MKIAKYEGLFYLFYPIFSPNQKKNNFRNNKTKYKKPKYIFL